MERFTNAGEVLVVAVVVGVLPVLRAVGPGPRGHVVGEGRALARFAGWVRAPRKSPLAWHVAAGPFAFGAPLRVVVAARRADLRFAVLGAGDLVAAPEARGRERFRGQGRRRGRGMPRGRGRRRGQGRRRGRRERRRARRRRRRPGRAVRRREAPPEGVARGHALREAHGEVHGGRALGVGRRVDDALGHVERVADAEHGRLAGAALGVDAVEGPAGAAALGEERRDLGARRGREARAGVEAWAGKSAKFPTLEAHISVIFHSSRLIFGRAIISRSALEAWMLFPERARAEHSC